MKKKTMTVALALMLAAGGCRSGLEATESLKTKDAAVAETAATDSTTTTVSEKILSSIHRIEDECAAAIVRFVDGGGEIRVDSAGGTSASGVASIEGRRHTAAAISATDYGDYEGSAKSAGSEQSRTEEYASAEQSASEKKTDSSQGSMWLSIFFLCLGYFLTGAAIRITKHVKE